MFIPLQHESNQGRRWPVVTIAILLLNVVAFLGTHWRMDDEAPKRGEVRAHLILLSASHPDLALTPEAQTFVDTFKHDNPALWKQASAPDRMVEDSWDARFRAEDDPITLQNEMDSLCTQFTQLQLTSFLGKYGYVPAHPTAISYITANFLHGGWLHIIFNLWFLWLAGAILEDTWGRPLFACFYLLGGAFALQCHGWMYPHSTAPTIGASGAVAALMGAFLARFPTTKIEVAVVLTLRSIANLAMGKGIRFKAAAYWLLPLWLGTEILSSLLLGNADGVAHSAHIAGFLFGGAFALGLRYTGLEKSIDKSIEAKVGWSADEPLVQGNELMEQGKNDEAITVLEDYVKTKPDSAHGFRMLQQLYWRKNDMPNYRNAGIRCCQAHLKAHDVDSALQVFDELSNSGAEAIPASLWLELSRAIEGKELFDRAVEEYDRLAQAYPTEKQSLLALLAAGRVSLKKLNRPDAALRYYRAAAASPVPHLDWESNIQNGIREAESASLVGSSRS